MAKSEKKTKFPLPDAETTRAINEKKLVAGQKAADPPLLLPKRSRIIRYEQVSPRGNAEVDTSRLMFGIDGRMFIMGVDDVFTACTPEQVAAIDAHFGDDLRVLFFGALERLADTE